MNKLFKDAKFGDRFRMRNGETAVFIKRNKYIGKYLMLRLDDDGYEKVVVEYHVNIDGKREKYIETEYDIISKWKEERL